MKNCSVLDWVAFVLLVIGGLNLGLVGFFDYNLISTIFGDATVVSRIVYGLIGLSAVYALFFCCKCCGKSSKSSKGGSETK